MSLLDNTTLHIISETGAIVIGSMLMGILLGYLYWGEYKKKSIKLSRTLDLERDQALQQKEKYDDLEAIRQHLTNEIQSERNKFSSQSKTIYDQQIKLFEYERQIHEITTVNQELRNAIDGYENRIRLMEQEIVKPKEEEEPIKKITVTTARANYEHVSNLLGRQVIEDDLTVIVGIGPRTAALLESKGIETWGHLSVTTVEELQQILEEAGGVYKSLDPTHWPKQAAMASQSEWRKLRVYQETLRKIE